GGMALQQHEAAKVLAVQGARVQVRGRDRARLLPVPGPRPEDRIHRGELSIEAFQAPVHARVAHGHPPPGPCLALRWSGLSALCCLCDCRSRSSVLLPSLVAYALAPLQVVPRCLLDRSAIIAVLEYKRVPGVSGKHVALCSTPRRTMSANAWSGTMSG